MHVEPAYLKRRYFPELIHCVGRGNEIANRMNDYCSKASGWNIEEHRRERIYRKKNDQASDKTGQRSAYSGLGLDGSP